jgi:translation initiation factor 1
VVRLERKGRGGKEVTVIEKLALEAGALDGWLADLKGALGCGGVREEETLVLQGDQRTRVAELLLAKGVKRVVQG